MSAGRRHDAKGPFPVGVLALLAIVVAPLTHARDASAEPSIAVRVSVMGRGSIRLRIADGSVVPCSSSSNKMLFDGWVSAGTTLAFRSRTASVCYEHTYGSFRRTNWSASCVASMPRDGTRPLVSLPVEISTERPSC